MTPWQIINNTVKMTALPHEIVQISGRNATANNEPVSISYENKTDTAETTVNKTKTIAKDKDIEPWLRLFFQKPAEKKEKTDFLMKTLQNAGIDTTKKMLSVTEKGGELIYVIGREQESDTTPFVSLYHKNFLPFKIFYGSRDVTFREYHKSKLPLAFPGIVEIREKGQSVVIYNFMRNEFEQ